MRLYIVLLALVAGMAMSCNREAGSEASSDLTVLDAFSSVTNSDHIRAIRELVNLEEKNFEENGWRLYRISEHRKSDLSRQNLREFRVTYDYYVNDRSEDKDLNYYIVPSVDEGSVKVALRKISDLSPDGLRADIFLEAYNWDKLDLDTIQANQTISFDFSVDAASLDDQVAANSIKTDEFSRMIAFGLTRDTEQGSSPPAGDAWKNMFKSRVSVITGHLIGSAIVAAGLAFAIRSAKRTRTRWMLAAPLAASAIYTFYRLAQLSTNIVNGMSPYGKLANQIREFGVSFIDESTSFGPRSHGAAIQVTGLSEKEIGHLIYVFTQRNNDLLIRLQDLANLAKEKNKSIEFRVSDLSESGVVIDGDKIGIRLAVSGDSDELGGMVLTMKHMLDMGLQSLELDHDLSRRYELLCTIDEDDSDYGDIPLQIVNKLEDLDSAFRSSSFETVSIKLYYDNSEKTQVYLNSVKIHHSFVDTIILEGVDAVYDVTVDY